MATTGPDDAQPKPNNRAEGENLAEMRLQGQLQAHLGGSLKAIYQVVLDEPVPERLLKLLGELERKEKKSS